MSNFIISIIGNKIFSEIISEIKLFSKFNIKYYEDIDLSNIALNSWYHIGLTADNMNLKIYLNGEIMSSKNFNSIIKNNSGKIYITKNSDFSGQLSDIKYFDHTINKNQVNYHYSKTFSEQIKTQDFISNNISYIISN